MYGSVPVRFGSVQCSSCRPALESWTADDGDEMRIVQFVTVQFTSVLAELERTVGAPTETDGCLQATADDERRRTARRAR